MEFDEVHIRAKSQGLSFGMLKFDGVVMPHPPVLRAMDELKAKLQAAGHEVSRMIILSASRYVYEVHR
jgi:amidase